MRHFCAYRGLEVLMSILPEPSVERKEFSYLCGWIVFKVTAVTARFCAVEFFLFWQSKAIENVVVMQRQGSSKKWPTWLWHKSPHCNRTKIPLHSPPKQKLCRPIHFDTDCCNIIHFHLIQLKQLYKTVYCLTQQKLILITSKAYLTTTNHRFVPTKPSNDGNNTTPNPHLVPT